MGYWWDDDPSERFWVEIRRRPGLGSSLWSPNADTAGRTNAWYDLVGSVKRGETVYHYNARERRFVARTRAAMDALEDPRAGFYRVDLEDYTGIDAPVDLASLRMRADDLYELRDRLERRYPDRPLYLPFQFKRDRQQFALMSNYFAKLPKDFLPVLFGSDGLARSHMRTLPRSPGNAPPSEKDATVDPGAATGVFLDPFAPKADSDYTVQVVGGRRKRTRSHEKLVNDCASWLQRQGREPGRNAAIDLGTVTPPTVIEAKIVGSSWATSIREAVGQLYEYRYFRVSDPQASLIFLASEAVPEKWIAYLERDREIGVMWPTGTGYYLSKKAERALRF